MTRRELLTKFMVGIGSMFSFSFANRVAKANSQVSSLSSIVLHYDENKMLAPMVLASTHFLADEGAYKTALWRYDAIIFSAHAKMLAEKYPPNTVIKREDYNVVAEILAYLYKLKGAGNVKSWCIYEDRGSNKVAKPLKNIQT